MPLVSIIHLRTMAVRASARRGGRRVVALALLALCTFAGSAVAQETSAVDAPSASDGTDSDPFPSETTEDDADADLPTSEDVPVHRFETAVVTIGKASGKERRTETGAFFLRGDDPAAAATRFVYLHSVPLHQIIQYVNAFTNEWNVNVPEAVKPRVKRNRRSKPLTPMGYLARGKEHSIEGRDDEAHFDYARALANVFEDPSEMNAVDSLDGVALADANSLLEHHHRKHSRALNAADKSRETREKAHEREVAVFYARRELRKELLADEGDFFKLWNERYVNGGSQDSSSAGSSSDSSVAHVLALHAAVEAKDWDRVIEVSASADTSGDPAPEADVPLRKLAVARAYWHKHEFRQAERYANAAVATGKKNGDWRRGQVRAIAVATGAYSSIKRGDAEGALKFFAAAKRADPDTPLFKEPYKAIKAAEKLLKDADLKLDRGESRQAMESADEAVAKLRGLGGSDPCEGSGGCVGISSITTAHGMFSGADARRCRAHAQMRSFEQALEACDRSLKMLGCLGERDLGDKSLSDADKKVWDKHCNSADAKHRARAFLARSEVHTRDQYYDGALQDLRTAQEIIEPSASRGSSEASRLLTEIQEKSRAAESSRRTFENNRDHSKMLDLPENLNELTKERRCDFIKKAYKKAALKWHPDKAIEAGKLRAARKMNEMTEARDHVNVKLGCVEPKHDPNEQHGRNPYGHHHQQQHAYHQQYYQQQQRQRHPGGNKGGGQYRHSWEF